MLPMSRRPLSGVVVLAAACALRGATVVDTSRTSISVIANSVHGSGRFGGRGPPVEDAESLLTLANTSTFPPGCRYPARPDTPVTVIVTGFLTRRQGYGGCAWGQLGGLDCLAFGNRRRQHLIAQRLQIGEIGGDVLCMGNEVLHRDQASRDKACPLFQRGCLPLPQLPVWQAVV